VRLARPGKSGDPRERFLWEAFKVYHGRAGAPGDRRKLWESYCRRPVMVTACAGYYGQAAWLVFVVNGSPPQGTVLIPTGDYAWGDGCFVGADKVLRLKGARPGVGRSHPLLEAAKSLASEFYRTYPRMPRVFASAYLRKDFDSMLINSLAHVDPAAVR
jgi:hypothetical protein